MARICSPASSINFDPYFSNKDNKVFIIEGINKTLKDIHKQNVSFDQDSLDNIILFLWTITNRLNIVSDSTLEQFYSSLKLVLGDTSLCRHAISEARKSIHKFESQQTKPPTQTDENAIANQSITLEDCKETTVVQDGNEINITIKSEGHGSPFPLNLQVNENEKISSIKKMIQEKVDIPVVGQTFIYAGRVLDNDNLTLKQSNIRTDTAIHFVKSLRTSESLRFPIPTERDYYEPNNVNNGGSLDIYLCVAIAGVLEYLTAEIAELSGNIAKKEETNNEEKVIMIKHIQQAMKADEEFKTAIENVSLTRQLLL